MDEMKSVALLEAHLRAALDGIPASSKDGANVLEFAGAMREVQGDERQLVAFARAALLALGDRQRAALVTDLALGSSNPSSKVDQASPVRLRRTLFDFFPALYAQAVLMRADFQHNPLSWHEQLQQLVDLGAFLRCEFGYGAAGVVDTKLELVSGWQEPLLLFQSPGVPHV